MRTKAIVIFAAVVLPLSARAIPPPGYPSGPCSGASLCSFNPPQLLVVPAFFGLTEHSDPSKATDWVRIQNAGEWVRSVVALGDSGGFQAAPLDTDCAPAGSGGEWRDAKAQFTANHQVGQSVFGYVNTQFATADYTVTTSAISVQLNAWQTMYPTQIQGMFLDNGPSFAQSPKSDQDFRNYYIKLYSNLSSPAFNAGLGWQVMLNASGFPGQNSSTGQFGDGWILSAPAADSAVVFEQPRAVFDSEYGALVPGGNRIAAPAWWTSNSAYFSSTAHIVSEATQYDVPHVADQSKALGASLLYTFDGNSQAGGGKGYDHVSCYFEESVTYLQAHQLASGAGKTWCLADAVPACHDLRSDTQHCGSCTNSCSPGWSCQSSTCVAPPLPALTSPPPPPPPPTPAPPPQKCKNCFTP
jgi:hypothetical protein